MSRFMAQTSVAVSQCSHEKLRKSPFFQDCEQGFLTRLMQDLEVELFKEGDIIIQQGDDGDKLYCLQMGDVDVLVGPTNLKVASLKEGTVFGEMAMFNHLGAGFAKRSATIRAQTFCDCRVLSKLQFTTILKQFPKERLRFEKIAQDRKENLERSKAAAEEEKKRASPGFQEPQAKTPQAALKERTASMWQAVKKKAGLGRRMSLPVSSAYNLTEQSRPTEANTRRPSIHVTMPRPSTSEESREAVCQASACARDSSSDSGSDLESCAVEEGDCPPEKMVPFADVAMALIQCEKVRTSESPPPEPATEALPEPSLRSSSMRSSSLEVDTADASEGLRERRAFHVPSLAPPGPSLREQRDDAEEPPRVMSLPTNVIERALEGIYPPMMENSSDADNSPQLFLKSAGPALPPSRGEPSGCAFAQLLTTRAVTADAQQEFSPKTSVSMRSVSSRSPRAPLPSVSLKEAHRAQPRLPADLVMVPRRSPSTRVGDDASPTVSTSFRSTSSFTSAAVSSIRPKMPPLTARTGRERLSSARFHT